MSYKAVTIYTPSGTQPHISAADDAFIYNALAGGNSGILGNLTCTVVNDRLIRLAGGGASNKGYIIYIPTGASHELSVGEGTQSLKRHDIIVAEFKKGGGTDPDEHIFKIITGTPAASPQDPQLTTSSLLSEDDVNQLPLFRLNIDGLAIDSIDYIAPSLSACEYIKCTAQARITTILANNTQMINLRSSELSGGRCFAIYNGSLMCKVSGVVEVYGSVYMSGGTVSGAYKCFIMRNNDVLTPGIRAANAAGAVISPPQLVEVNAGDFLTLYAGNINTDCECNGSDAATWLTARYLN